MEKKTIVALFLIVLLAFGLRFIFLTYNPPSLNWDEVSHGYNAYALLKTGRDEWGKAFPIANFRAYGDYPLPLNLYLVIPFITVFGLTEFAIRFPHVILGVLGVVSTYFLASGLTKKKNIALISAFLMAVSPWTFFTSRFVLQSNISIFLLTTSLACFFNRDKKKFLLPVSFFLLGLSLFAYNTTRIFSPLLLLAMIVLYRKRLYSITNLLIVLVFFLPLPFILQNKEARARSFAVSIIDQGAVAKIESQRAASKLPKVVSRVVYNRPVYFIEASLKNYLGYFSPNFLFLKGGTQYQFSVPNQGLIAWVNMPFFYIGLFWLFSKGFKKGKAWKFILIWILLAPIPAAITSEQYAVLRSTAMLPIPFILSAIGLERFMTKRAWVLPIYLIFSFVILGSYLQKYFGEYRTDYSWAWQYGYKEAVDYVKENYAKYDKIIITKKYGEPHEFFLFFWPWDPAKYVSDPNLIRFHQSNWYWVDRFDKFYFVNDWQVKELKLESGGKVDCAMIKCLLITSPDNFPGGWKKLNTINFLDGKPAFEIYENL